MNFKNIVIIRIIISIFISIIFTEGYPADTIKLKETLFIDAEIVVIEWNRLGADHFAVSLDGIETEQTDNHIVILSSTAFDTVSLSVEFIKDETVFHQSDADIFTACFQFNAQNILWLTGNDADTVADGNVQTWADKSMRGFDMTQTDPTKMPKLIKEQDFTHLNFSAQWLENSIFYDIDSMQTIYYLLRHDGTTSGYNFIFSKTYSGAAGSISLIQLDGFSRNYIDGNNYTTNIPIDNNWGIFSYRKQASSFLTEKNFSLSHTVALSVDYSGHNDYPLTIGKDAAANRYYFGGDIAEILIFSRPLTDQENLFVKKYLSWKYSPPIYFDEDLTITDAFCDTAIHAGTNYNSYLWDDGTTNERRAITKDGTYSVTVENLFGEISSDSITVIYPKVALRDTFFCSNDSTFLTTGLDPTLFDFAWSTGEPADIIWVKTEGDYSVEVFDKFGCSKVSNTVSVTENTFPLTNFLPNDTTLCQGNSLHPNIQNKSTLSFLWNDGGTDSLTIIGNAGEFSAAVTDQFGCLAKDSVNVAVQGVAPSVNFSFDTVCFGTQTAFIDLTTSPDPVISREWQFGDGSSLDQNPTHIFGTSGKKTVSFQVETDAGCLERAAKSVTVGEIPQTHFAVTNGDFGCNSSPLPLVNKTETDADTITQWNWDFGNGDLSTSQLPNYLYPTSGDFTISLTATSEFNCSSEFNIPVTIYDNIQPACQPQLNLPADQEIILDSVAELRWGNTCNAYSQILEIATDSLFVNIVTDTVLGEKAGEFSAAVGFGKYWWRVSNINACKDTVVSDTLAFELFAPELVSGMKLWLKADAGVEKDEFGLVELWKDQSGSGKDVFQSVAEQRPQIVDSSIYIHPAVRFDGVNDLLVGQNLYVDEHDLSIFIVHKFDGLRKNKHQHILCQYGDLGIKYRVWATANTDYRLSFGSLGSSYVGVNPYSDSDFTLTSIISGIESSFYSNSGLNSSGTIGNFNGMEMEFVIGSYVSNNISQLFSGDIAEIIIFDRAISDEERLKMEAYLYDKYQPEPVYLGEDIDKEYDLCADTLSAPTGYKSYNWSTGQSSVTIQTVELGDYAVTVENDFGLTYSDEIHISRPDLQFNDTAVCAGESLIISPATVAGYSYFWNDGATDSSRVIPSSGNYSLTVTDSLGCSRTLVDRTISIDSFPLKMSIGSDIQVHCKDQTIGLVTGENVATYNWSDGSSAPLFTVTQSETVSLTATDTWGCSGIDSVNVQLQGLPILTDFLVFGTCFGDTTVLSSSSVPKDSIADIFWTIDGFMASKADTYKFIFDQEGWHVVNLRTLSVSGCVQAVEKYVFINPRPAADFVIDEICANAEHRFISTSMPGNGELLTNYNWDFSGDGAASGDTVFFNYTTSGIKSIAHSVTNSFGCSDEIVKTIEVLDDYLPAGSASLTIPQNSAIFSDSIVHFEWEVATNAYQYHILVSSDASFADTVDQTFTFDHFADLKLSLSGEYFWKVRSLNICGKATASSVGTLIRTALHSQPQMVLWLKADAGITKDANGLVSQWDDQSLAGNNVTQTNASYMPIYSKDAINGKPALRFDGVNDYLKTVTTGVEETDITIFIVSKFAEEKASNLNSLLTQKTNTGVRYSVFAPANSGNELQLNSYPPEEEPLRSISYGADFYKITRVVGRADSSFIYTNAGLTGQALTKVHSGTDQTLLIGGYFTNKLTFGLSGDIAEIMIFDTALNISAIDTIENYLFNKYTTPLELGQDIDYALCKSEIQAPDKYLDYQWNTGETTSATDISHTGTYALTVTDMLGKVWSDSVVVSRPFPNIISDTTICLNDAIVWDLGMPNTYLYQWSNGSTESSISITDAGQYAVTVTDTLGCPAFYDPVAISVDSFPIQASIGEDRSMCKGEYLVFESEQDSEFSFQWSSLSSKNYDTVFVSGNYSLTATNSRGCLFVDTVSIAVTGQAPDVSVALPKICKGTETDFSATINALPADPVDNILWVFNSKDSVSETAPSYIFSKDGSATIKLEATTQGGCVGSFIASAPVLYNPVSEFEIIFGDIHCTQSPVSFEAADLYADSVKKFNWSFDSTGQTVSSIFETGNYEIDLSTEYVNGCVALHSDSLFVLNNMPVAGRPDILAPDDGAVLFDNMVHFQWDDATDAQYYSFRLSTEPALQFGLVLDSLTDTDFDLSIADNQTYFWQVWSHSFCGDTVKSELQSFTKSDIDNMNPSIWLKAGDLSAADGQLVNKWIGRGQTFQQSDLTKCPIFTHGSSASGNAPAVAFGNKSYLEGGIDLDLAELSTVFLMVNLDQATTYEMLLSKGYTGEGSYTVAIANAKNQLRTYTDNKNITTTESFLGWNLITTQLKQDSLFMWIGDTLLLAKATGVDNIGINGYPLTLGKSGQNASYYFNGDIAEIITFDKFLDENDVSSVLSYFKAKYQASLNLTDTVFANVFDPISLEAPDGFRSYTWNNGITSASQFTDSSGTYILSVTDLWGNELVDSTVVIFPEPFVLNDSSKCAGKSIVWNAELSGNFTYQWLKNGALFKSGVNNITAKTTGFYQLVITDENGGEFRSDSVMLEFIDLTGSLAFEDTVTLCKNELLEPSRLPENVVSYAWNTGSSSPFIYITTEGDYNLSITNDIGCKTLDSVHVRIAGTAPEITLNLADHCENVKSNFYPTIETAENIAEIFWEIKGVRNYTDTLQKYFIPQNNLKLKVSVELESGCKSVAYDTLNILTVPARSISVFPSKVHCVSNNYTLTTNDDLIAEYNWQIINGSQTSLLSKFEPQFSDAGEYGIQLDILFDNGCLLSVSDKVATVNDLADADVPVLESPFDESSVFDPQVQFSWSEENAAHYSLVIASDSLFNNVLFNYDSILPPHYSASLADGFYYWQVTAYSHCGGSSQSDVFAFEKASMESFHPIIWADAQALTSADQSLISTIGVAGYEGFSQADPLFKPLYHKSINSIGNKSAVEFIGKSYMEGIVNLPLDSMKTILAMVETTPTGSYGMVFSKHHTGEGSLTLAKNNTGMQYRFYVDGVSKITQNEYPGWALVACTFYNDSLFIYMDGKLEGAYKMGKDFSGLNALPITLGKQAGANANYFNGQLAELIVLTDSIYEQDYLKIKDYFRYKYQPEIQLPDTVQSPLFKPYELAVAEGFRYYTWNNGASTNSVIADSSGTYSLTVTDFLGEQHTAQSFVHFPEISSPAETVFCRGNSVQWNSGLSYPFSFVWYKDSVELSVSNSIMNISSPGRYQLQVIDSAGFSMFSDSYVFTQVELSEDIILSDSVELCSNQTYEPTNTAVQEISYSWNTGELTGFVTVDNEQYYILSATDEYGCSMFDSVYVSIKGYSPNISLASDTICMYEDYALISGLINSESAPFEAYSWIIGDSTIMGDTASYIFTSAGSFSYKLSADAAGGCSSEAYDTVVVKPVFEVDIIAFPDTLVCSGAQVSFSLKTDFRSEFNNYSWSNTENSEQSFVAIYESTFIEEGTQIVVLETTQKNGCSGSFAQQLLIQSLSAAVKTPAFSSPEPNAIIFADTTTLRWNAEDAAYYRVTVARDDQLANIVTLTDSLRQESLLLSQFSNGLYYASVQAYGYCGNIANSDTLSFEVLDIESYDPVLWLNASDLSLTDGQAVGNWDYKGKSLAQADPAKRPVFEGNSFGINNQPSVQFGNSSFLEGMADLPLDSIRTVYMLSKFSEAGNYEMILSKGYTGTNPFTLAKSNGNAEVRVYADGLNKTSSSEYPGWNLISLRISSTQVELFVNGKLESVFSHKYDMTGVNALPLTLGKAAGANSYFFNGNIAEVMIFKTEQTDDQLTKIHQYFKTKYSGTLNLPDSLTQTYGFKPIVLNPNIGFSTYEWSTGEISESVSVTDEGFYALTATSLFGNVSIDSVFVQLPQFPVLMDTAFCFQSALTLNATMGDGYFYDWNNGSTSPKVYINQTGEYSVSISDTLGYFRTFGPVAVDIDFFTQEATLGADIEVCEGNRIGLVAQSERAVEFLWSDSTTAKSFEVTESGEVSVWSKNTRGCEMRDTIQISVKGVAPQVTFTVDGHCVADSLGLVSSAVSTDTSEIKSYNWTIADVTLTGLSTKTKLSKKGKYTITHTVVKNDGCADSATQSVTIYENPQLDFLPLQACLNVEVHFRPVNVQSYDAIQRYTWSINGKLSGDNQPVAVFDSVQTLPVTLLAETDKGCAGTVAHSFAVKPNVKAQFVHTPICINEPVGFFNQTIYDPTNPVVEGKWFVNGYEYKTLSNYSYTFSSTGVYQMGLSLKTVNGCESSVFEDITVLPVPQMYLSIPDVCLGESVRLQADSIIPADAVQSIAWYINEEQIDLSDTLFVPAFSGIYPVSADLKTVTGCVSNYQANFEVKESPIAGFWYDDESKYLPFTLQLTDTSLLSQSRQWVFVGGDTLTDAVSSVRISDAAPLAFTFIAENASGCRDSIVDSLHITFGSPQITAQEMLAFVDGSFNRTVFVVENTGGISLEHALFFLEVNNELFIKEEWTGQLEPGAQLPYYYTANLDLNGEDASRICVYAGVVNNDLTITYTDTICSSLAENFVALPIYPNPANKYLKVDFSIPEDAIVKFEIIAVDGEQIGSWEKEYPAGANAERIDVRALSSGMYTLNVYHGTDKKSERFVKMKP